MLKPPTSPTASVQCASSSAWSSTRRWAPRWPPASSSAVKHNVIGRSGHCSRAGPRPDDREHHRVEVLHVDRPAAPDEAVADLAREGVHLPVLGRRGHDVQVAVQQQAVAATRGPAPLGDHVRATGLGLDDQRLDTDLVEQRGDVLGGLPLPRSVLVAVVGGVEPDQVPADLDDLARGVVDGSFGAVRVVGHAAHQSTRQGPFWRCRERRIPLLRFQPHSSGWRNWQTR